eukprot:4860515-Pyramimonas_sp.AAC.1
MRCSDDTTNDPTLHILASLGPLVSAEGFGTQAWSHLTEVLCARRGSGALLPKRPQLLLGNRPTSTTKPHVWVAIHIEAVEGAKPAPRHKDPRPNGQRHNHTIGIDRPRAREVPDLHQRGLRGRAEAVQTPSPTVRQRVFRHERGEKSVAAAIGRGG